jgi:hypothetical protein
MVHKETLGVRGRGSSKSELVKLVYGTIRIDRAGLISIGPAAIAGTSYNQLYIGARHFLIPGIQALGRGRWRCGLFSCRGAIKAGQM